VDGKGKIDGLLNQRKKNNRQANAHRAKAKIRERNNQSRK
jgi:hypothetical protein